jgi:arylsulfatase A-like enzyme
MTKPNILLLFPDQHRGDFMPFSPEICANSKIPCLDLEMPNIRDLMARGTTFTNCVTPSPICAPARACLALGSRYEDCGVKDNSVDFPTDRKTMYQVLRDKGYQVMGTGKFDLHKGTNYWGKEGWVDSLEKIGFTCGIDNEGKYDAIIGEMSFSKSQADPAGSVQNWIDLEKDHERGPYINYLYQRGKARYHVEDFKRRYSDIRDIRFTELDEEEYCDNWIASNTLSLLERKDPSKPWFMQVNFSGPHDPWDVRKEMYEMIRHKEFPATVDGDTEKQEIDAEIKKRYIAMIENIDRNIGIILEKLKADGDFGNTVVIYASDHGEMLGDHRRFGKSVWYRQSVQVPLVISGPGIASSIGNDSPVELQDLANTILDFAGGALATEDSISLKGILYGNEKRIRTYQYSALADWKLYKDDLHKFILKDGKPILFDIKEDFDELKDIAVENPALCKEYAEKIRGIGR